MRAVLPSVSVTRRPLQYGKIRQINSSSPGSAYLVSTCLRKQAASVSQSPLPLADLLCCWHRLLCTYISRPPVMTVTPNQPCTTLSDRVHVFATHSTVCTYIS